jgi:hypothetical protein
LFTEGNAEREESFPYIPKEHVGPKDFRLVAHKKINLGVVNEDWVLADSCLGRSRVAR